MPRKKTTEPEGMEQATGMEQSGLTGENVDAAAVPDETASQDGFPAGTPAEGAADAIPEKTPPHPALETEAVGAEPLPPDEEESLWNVPPAKEQLPSRTEAEPATAPAPEKTDRQAFFNLNFNALDRGLTAEERQEWNSIYASYRGRSALTGKIIGVDPLSISVRNRQTGALDRQTMYCAVVVPYRVRIVIPASEMWEDGQERPDFVLQNMVGASIDFVVIKVDRESGFAVASRRMAARSQRYFFSHRPALHREGARAKCRVLSVGPRRCLVECYGHDINLTQRDLRYTVIPDLRDAYHPGLHCQELRCRQRRAEDFGQGDGIQSLRGRGTAPPGRQQAAGVHCREIWRRCVLQPAGWDSLHVQLFLSA